MTFPCLFKAILTARLLKELFIHSISLSSQPTIAPPTVADVVNLVPENNWSLSAVEACHASHSEALVRRSQWPLVWNHTSPWKASEPVGMLLPVPACDVPVFDSFYHWLTSLESYLCVSELSSGIYQLYRTQHRYKHAGTAKATETPVSITGEYQLTQHVSSMGYIKLLGAIKAIKNWVNHCIEKIPVKSCFLWGYLVNHSTTTHKCL